MLLKNRHLHCVQSSWARGPLPWGLEEKASPWHLMCVLNQAGREHRIGDWLLITCFHRFRAIIIRNGEIIPMSSEFTPETERQRLQYLVRVPWVWQSTRWHQGASGLFGRNALLLTWERAHSRRMTYGMSSPTHTF